MWQDFQGRLVEVARRLDDEHLKLRSSAEMWDVGTLFAHIIAARAWWWNSWMGEGSDVLRGMERWDDFEELHSRVSELARGLEVTWSVIQETAGRWTQEDLAVEFRHPRVTDRPPRSRRWIISHILEHDLFHGGELSQVLGMHGVPGIDL